MGFQNLAPGHPILPDITPSPKTPHLSSITPPPRGKCPGTVRLCGTYPIQSIMDHHQCKL